MDHTRDNPLKRFTAFWVALLLVTAFGIAAILLRPLTHAQADSTIEAKAEERRAVRADVDREQSKNLSGGALDEALAASAKSLHSSKPAPSAIKVPPATPAVAPADQPEPAAE